MFLWQYCYVVYVITKGDPLATLFISFFFSFIIRDKDFVSRIPKNSRRVKSNRRKVFFNIFYSKNFCWCEKNLYTTYIYSKMAASSIFVHIFWAHRQYIVIILDVCVCETLENWKIIINVAFHCVRVYLRRPKKREIHTNVYHISP